MKKKLFTLMMALVMAVTVFAIDTNTASASSRTYWLKVNRTCNVVNVYKKENGSWKPYKVMLCSVGKSGKTPKGTFHIAKKWRWHIMMGGVYGQYVSQYYGNYLFHSVPCSYKSIKGVKRDYYNKLGTAASHGCIRLCVMDAKWIYKNCSSGTRVTTYNSSNPGPLGKPKKVAMRGSSKNFYDPTDPAVPSKYFGMTGPKITIKNKAATCQYGATFRMMKGVTAKSPYTYQDLTSSVKVAKVRYSADGVKTYQTVSSKTVNTKRAGKYKITYSCHNQYCGDQTAYKTFTLTVKEQPQPTTTTEPETDQETEVTRETETESTMESTEPASETQNTQGEIQATDPIEP